MKNLTSIWLVFAFFYLLFAYIDNKDTKQNLVIQSNEEGVIELELRQEQSAHFPEQGPIRFQITDESPFTIELGQGREISSSKGIGEELIFTSDIVTPEVITLLESDGTVLLEAEAYSLTRRMPEDMLESARQIELAFDVMMAIGFTMITVAAWSVLFSKKKVS